MRGLPTELVILLLFGIALLFNLLMQRATKRRRAEAAQHQPAQAEAEQQQPAQGESAHEEIPESVWRVPSGADLLQPRITPVAAHRRAAAPALPAARSRRRYARQMLLGSRRKVQDAFVVAAILGRCRGDEPHDIR